MATDALVLMQQAISTYNADYNHNGPVSHQIVDLQQAASENQINENKYSAIKSYSEHVI